MPGLVKFRTERRNMRNPNRLYNFYDEVRRIHMEHFPDWRFGQFIYNFIVWLNNRKSIDPFFPEEEEMLKLLREYAGEEN